jgi:uncharacterized membrane protein YfhO
MDQTSVPFLSTSAFIKSMGVSSDVYKEVELNISDVQNATEGGGNSHTGYKYTFSADKASVVITPYGATEGAHLYIFVVANKAPHVTIHDENMDTAETKETSLTARTYQMIDIGYYHENETKTITLKFNDSGLSGNFWIQCAEVVESAYQEMVEVLSDEQMKVLSYDSTHVEGVVTANEDGVLFLTIPYDESWTAMVDGKAAEILPVDDAFSAIRLTKGTHNIQLKYQPARFSMCVKISILSLAALVFLTIIRKILEHFRLKKLFQPKEAAVTVPGEEGASATAVEAMTEAVVPAGTIETASDKSTDIPETEVSDEES